MVQKIKKGDSRDYSGCYVMDASSFMMLYETLQRDIIRPHETLQRDIIRPEVGMKYKRLLLILHCDMRNALMYQE